MRFDTRQVTRFAQQLQDVPRELRGELRPAIKTAAKTLSSRVKANASWSSRIPGAVRERVSFASRGRGGVMVYVDARIAPHARPLDRGSQGGRSVNRHPVFGNRNVWVDQPTRPFFIPAVRESHDDVLRKVQFAIATTLGRIR